MSTNQFLSLSLPHPNSIKPTTHNPQISNLKPSQQQPTNPQSNHHRLIQQNNKLYKQIFRLQVIITNLLNNNNNNKQSSQFTEQYQRLSKQNNKLFGEIKKLKKKILLIKNQQKPQEKQHLRQALDQLKYIKMQKQKYLIEKQAIIKKRSLKNQPLQLNKPISQQKIQLISIYKQTIHENNQHRTRIQYLQKQLKQLHNLKHLSKSLPSSQPQPQLSYQLSKIQHQIFTLTKQTNQIQTQWKPRIQSLNKQYFLYKQIQKQKQLVLKQKQKQINLYKNRILCIKPQIQIIEQKERVKKVKISKEKRNQIKDKINDQIIKSNWLNQMKKRVNNDKKGNNNNINNINPQRLKKLNKSKSKQKQQIQSQKLQIYQNNQPQQAPKQNSRYSQKIQNHNQFHNIQKLKTTAFSVKNQFSSLSKHIQSHLIQNKQKQKQKQKQVIIVQVKQKPKKTFLSVAIGTTFYYNENQDINEQDK